jgi:hypothetical protein
MAVQRKTTKQSESKGSLIGGVKLPVSYEQFVKNPVAAVAFCMLLAVGYLYIDQKNTYNDIIVKQGQELSYIRGEVNDLKERIRRSDSLLSSASSKIAVFQQLGKIPQ